jgi:hypothetical protein
LNNNTNDDRCNRLWRTLATCLTYFPPSKEFENYFEWFLLTEVPVKGKANADTCIRLMHKSIFKYGYNSTKTSDDTLRTIKESLTNNILLKSTNINTNLNDINVITTPNFHLRGAKLNWNQRFSLLQKATSSKSTGITKNNFEMYMNINIDIDKLDKEVLLFLITGLSPVHSSRITLENNAHKYLYIYDNIEAKKISEERVTWLLHNIQIPDYNPEQQINEMNSIFWEFVIEKINTFFNLENGLLAFDVYRDIIIAGQNLCRINSDKKKKQKHIML